MRVHRTEGRQSIVYAKPAPLNPLIAVSIVLPQMAEVEEEFVIKYIQFHPMIAKNKLRHCRRSVLPTALLRLISNPLRAPASNEAVLSSVQPPSRRPPLLRSLLSGCGALAFSLSVVVVLIGSCITWNNAVASHFELMVSMFGLLFVSTVWLPLPCMVSEVVVRPASPPLPS